MNKRIKDTINFYDKNAENYFDTTVNIDMSPIYNRFLKYIPKNGYVLDFGCGSGRDSKYFLEQGYKVKSIDGSKKLSELATLYIGQKVKCMNFLEFNEENLYDGIWACASIIHLTNNELVKVLKKLSMALKNYGYLYISFKNGVGFETIDGKYFNYFTKESFGELLSCYKELTLIDMFETELFNNIKETRYWNNFILQKK